MKCPSCGIENLDDSQFCRKCATALTEEAAFTRTFVKGPEEFTAGTVIASHYKITRILGRGGMGVVYLADDTRLKRPVALKFLPPGLSRDEDFRKRFIIEAQAAAALSHPNICTIFEVDDQAEKAFISMEYIEGENLKEKATIIGPLAFNCALDIALQVCAGLDEAHKKGIVHRDIKSANIMLTAKGKVKIMDFGLAKVVGSAMITKEGSTMGTVAYMSPEQARGEAVDVRTDIWSLGVVLYELVSGKMPFKGDRESAIIHNIIHEEPKPLKAIVPKVPEEFARIVHRALRKNMEERYGSAAEMLADLGKLHAALEKEKAGVLNLPSFLRIIRKPLVAVPAALILIALGFLTYSTLNRQAKGRWAREKALPEIASLIQQDEYGAAFAVARQADSYIPKDPILAQLWPKMSAVVDIESTPPGAEISIRDYTAKAGTWQALGRTPISRIRLALGFFQVHLVKDGCQPREGWLSSDTHTLGAPKGTFRYELDPVGSVPAGMVRVPGVHPPFIDFGIHMISVNGLDQLPQLELGDYAIDKYEVTNKQYKEFVDAGGYRKPAYWKVPFVKDGRTLPFEEAVKQFVDSTGRPGPSTWELSGYPKGRDQYPVQGVSWYEAAAYSEFAGRRLPTGYHWGLAARMPDWIVKRGADIVAVSNFSGEGPAPVGQYQGVGPFGTYDMAGNVKEWCWNEAGGKRLVLGGAWNEGSYLFANADAQSPFERSAGYGFRTVSYLSEVGLPEASAPIRPVIRDYENEHPVSDDVFKIYESLYAYDKTDLKATIESIDDQGQDWRREKLSIAAAYGNEWVPAYLFLPKRGSPPYQIVVYFSHAGGLERIPSEGNLQIDQIAFFIKSGRAVLYPVVKGMYERYGPLTTHYPQPTNAYRDTVIQMSKDVRRAIDYLETRPEIDMTKLAYYGVSFGATMGPIMVAMEARFQTAIFTLGGFYLQRRAAEVDQVNFAPRVRCPVLMLNGRYDWIFPLDSSQTPMFRFLGTPEKDKKQVLFDTGHSVASNRLIKETLDWLDRYLGPVK
jgi:serine/threonine protein kinase/formylglycine-generating enzyme required for sulfatase activity/dienelactone hydrolase